MSSKNLEQQNTSVIFNTGAFRFSGAQLNSLESDHYTLVVLAIDTSISVGSFANQLLKVLKDTVRSLQLGKNSDNIMVRVINFDTKTNEVHGFTELNKCDLANYDQVFNKFGNSTSLYDASVDGLDSLNKYSEELGKPGNDYSTNGIFICITDGDDNSSSFTTSTVKAKLSEGVGEMKLESLNSILLGVNMKDSRMSARLKSFKHEVGFDQFEAIENVDQQAVAKLIGFLSKSISSVSSSLGHGKSQTLAF